MTSSDLARTLAAAPCVVHFIKADGTARRMLTAPSAEGVTARAGVVRVFDAEKGAWRSICAERVVSVTQMSARPSSRPCSTVTNPPSSLTSDFGGGYVGHRGRRVHA